MSLDHAILGFLNVGPLTGYDLKTRCFDSTVPHLWTADQAQVYRTLDRLEQRRLITSRVRPQSSRPNRKEYTITRAGREALVEWVSAPAPLPPVRDAFLLQLFFSDAVPDDPIIDLLCETRASHQQRLDALRARSAAWVRSAGPNPDRTQTVRRMALDGAISSQRATIDWLDDCIELVREGLPGSSRAAADPSSQRQLFGFPSPEGGSA